jgi:hypothetical protein
VRAGDVALQSGRVVTDASGRVRLAPGHHERALARLQRDVARTHVRT